MMFKALRIPLSALLTLACIMLLIPSPQAFAASSGLAWSSDAITVYAPPSGGVWYPRLAKRSNSEWLLSFDTNAGGGNTRIVVTRTTNGGQSWSAPVTAVSHPSGNVGNGQMLVLPGGEVWLAYRLVIQSGAVYTTSLHVRRSTDGGLTWSDLPGGAIASTTANGFKGVWEPHLEYINGVIHVLYADDSPAAVGTTGLQNLYMKPWTGSGWGARITLSDGVAAGSRDGMPVITRMNDGRYMMVFESSDVPGHPFVIKYKISADGLNWSVPRQMLYTPNGTGKKAGAPFVAKLADGRLIAAFQTDESSGNTGDPYTSMHTMISANNGATWEHKTNVFPVSDTASSNWNALMTIDSTRIAAVTSADHPASGIYLKLGYTLTPAQVNLANNPSFETANVTGWTTYGDDYPARILIHGANDGVGVPAAHGAYFIGLAGTSGPASAYIGQTITGLDDGAYTMTARMRSSGGQSSCIMEVKDYGGATRQAACPVTTAWTTVTIPDIQVVSGKATLGFYAANTSSAQWADVDQVSFTRQSLALAPGKTYRLMNPASEKMLEVDAWGTANGSNVILWDDHGGANQQWTLVSAGGGYYKLVNAHSGKALEVDGWSTADGGNVTIWADHGGDNQLWLPVHLGGGVYKWLNKHSGKALDVAGSGVTNGTNVQQWTDLGNSAQRWAMIQLTP
ncbi:RICIN domain-containing protein [Paenibacillus sp. 598K]|uniref:RICIN domain-containing protein n=1 Tax=Paenibacillus sp. 598K TaxID=1117987 RepID=UPI0021AAB382|nr:RICIN domain-containing protein [Paenibacillus sp. 598K]